MSKFTRKAIVDSFLRLLNEKSFEKITVKSIVEDCGVNRKTFYYYFEDIYDLVEKVFEEEIEKSRHLLSPEMSVEEIVNAFCDLIEKNKRIVAHAFFAAGENEMKRFFYNILCPAFASGVKFATVGKAISDDDIDTISRIFTFSIVGSVVIWISNGFDPDEKEKLKKVCIMLQGSAKLMIDNLEKYNALN